MINEEMLEYLRKKYLGKEMTLLEMDNLFECELNTNCSLFEDIETAIEQLSWDYIFAYDDNNGEYGIIVSFKILDTIEDLEDYEKMRDLKIKIDDIRAL